MNAPQIIPRVIHRIWLGSKPMLPRFGTFLAGQLRLCKDYHSLLWRDSDVVELFPFMLSSSVKMLQDERLNPVVKSDILRYELLRLFGGIYIDTDIEILRNFDQLLGETFFCAEEGGGNIGSALLGCVPFHPLCNAMLTEIYNGYVQHGPPETPNQQMNLCGPWLLTKKVKQFNVTVLDRQLLYPFHNPRLPATIHYFRGGDNDGWAKRVNPANHSPDMAGPRPDTGAPCVFFGRNNQVRS